jgi:4-amino-4-deoxy-L-arabinose transferase-like glycosyltransferase
LEKASARRNDVLALAAMAAIAIAVRFAAISSRGTYVSWDETTYLMLGRHLLTGQGYQLNGPPNITFPPLVPVIGGGVWLLTGSIRWALSAPSALLGGLAIVPVFLLARRMFSREAAFAAGTVFAGFRPLLYYSPFCSYRLRFYDGSEEIFLFIVCWALYFFWRAFEDRSILWAAAGGFACGVGFLARQESLAICGALVAWLAAGSIFAGRRFSWSLGGRLLAAAALFLAASAPFFAFAHSVTGYFTFGPHLSHNVVVRDAFRKVYYNDDWRDFLQLCLSLNEDNTYYDNSYYGVSPESLRAEGGSYSDAGVFGRLLAGTDLHAFRYWASNMRQVFPWYVSVFVLWGLLAGPLRLWRVRLTLLAAVLAPAAAIAMTLLVLPRYDLYTAGILAVFAGAGLAGVAAFLPRVKRPALVAAVAAAVLSVAGVLQAYAFNTATEGDSHRERHIERLTGPLTADLKRLAPPETPVVCHDPQAPLYAGNVWLPLPMAPFERIVDFARKRGAAMIVLKSTDCAPTPDAAKDYLRPFTFEEALARTDLIAVVLRGRYDNEDVAILAVQGAEAP